MKKNNILFKLVFCFIGILFSEYTYAQFTITPITNQNIKTILENNFLGEGVILDTTRPIYYNGKTIINNNQIGIFKNVDTSIAGKNIPMKSGLILATDACKKIAGGYESRQNPLYGAATNSPSLYLSYKKFCESDLNEYGNSLTDVPDAKKFQDVAVLDFYVIPQSCNMSFCYSFGSEEYPTYVCTGFNDFFGLYCDGPYNDDLEPCNEGVFYQQPNNIAIIPGTYDDDDFADGTPVMINTINNGNSNKICGIKHQEYFIDNRDKTNKKTTLGGYTKKLETAVLQTVPGKKYHIQIAICNINDEALQSAVFLEANSFKSDAISIGHNITKNSNNDGYEIYVNADNDTSYSFIKGCSTDTMLVSANYVAKENEGPYTFYVKQSNGSNIIRGIDYDYFKINNDGQVQTVPASNTIVIPQGDTAVRYLLTFMHNPEKAQGSSDTLLFIGTDCAGNPVDTISYIMKEPYNMETSVKGGTVTCHDLLPIIDTINIEIKNIVSSAKVIAKRNGQNIFEEECHTVWHVKDTTFIYQIPVTIKNVADTSSVSISIEDFCGRTFDTVINYKVLTSFTKANVDRNYICEGDSVILSCSEATSYQWSSSPKDITLMTGDKSKKQTMTVKPQKNTVYTITCTSEEGCVSSDTVSVAVEMLTKASMEIRPKKVYYSNPEISFIDLSDDAFERTWTFGDGTTSAAAKGFHTYSTDTSEDSHTYEVMLIVYNKAMCPDTITDSVQVVADFTIWMPNAFMPGDNNNGVAYFGPNGSLLKNWEMIIYNRWGTKVFQGKEKLWDGKLENGDFAPQGTYVYDIIYKDGGGLLQRKSGTFILLPSEKK